MWLQVFWHGLFVPLSQQNLVQDHTHPWRRGWCDPISDGLILLATVDVDQSFCSDRVTPAQQCLQVQIRGALNY